MLFLGSGTAMMTLVCTMTTIVSSVPLGVSFVALLNMSVELINMGLILYIIILAHRTWVVSRSSPQPLGPLRP